jgi:acetyl esterase/lipase
VLSHYGDDPSQLGELFLPDGDGASPVPVVVVLHGGFWRDRYDRHLMDELCADLTRRGLAAWNLEYRRLGSGGGWPATFEDVAAGIDHLAELDAPLALGCVSAVGHSAGGHLALWAAGRHRLPPGEPGAEPRVPVRRAVSQAGVSDVAEASRLALSNGVADELLGARPDEVPERVALASPRALLPLGVPQLLIHGGEDDTVPATMSRDYASAAWAAGDDRVALLVLPEQGHFEHIDPAEQAWHTAAAWLEAPWS